MTDAFHQTQAHNAYGNAMQTQNVERFIINDGLDFSRGAVLCYRRNGLAPEKWYRVLTHPVSLGRALHNNNGLGAAFAYVLETIDGPASLASIPGPEEEHWHVQSEFVRREWSNWKRWDTATNALQALVIVNRY